ncbi:uncharacterized protein BJX67DRAFT_357560 [Aspergillus lucknowensis]|uniref:Uncharacterized protein n=1 Tax=Aspergillus lucknowensis TaxID=176173 RepID=A0ABR4LR54_9EURO
MQPSTKEPRLPAPLGGPHVLFEGSFILEFLQPAPELNASVLMRATYKGGHELVKLGKKHPQAPPLHVHFVQSESFIVEAGAVGTTSTYDAIDTVHTTQAAHHQTVPRRGLSPPVLTRDEHGATAIPPGTPHNFWPVAPTHPFWSTPEGQEYVSTLPNGRNSDTTVLIWGYPKISNGATIGTLVSDFPPDMDAAFFLALLGYVDAISSKRISMTPSVFAKLFSIQTVSETGMVMAPTAWWLGPLRWWVPWTAQVTLERVRKLLGGDHPVKLVEDVIHNVVVKRQ